MNEILSNAEVTIVGIYECIDVLTGKSEEKLCLEIKFLDTGGSKQITYPYSKIGSRQFIELLEREGVIFNEVSAMTKKFKNQLLRQRRLVNSSKKLICPQGFFDYEGEKFCKLGQEIIMSNNTGLKFACDAKNEPVLRPSKDGAYKEALQFAFVDEMVSPMLLMYIGFSVWNDFFAAATHPQRFVLYIEGETGTMKSSLCREVVNIFNERAEMTLSSTYAALQTCFQKYRAVPVLLDDFNESEFKKIKKEKGEKLVEFIQMYADREELCKMNNKKMISLSTPVYNFWIFLKPDKI